MKYVRTVLILLLGLLVEDKSLGQVSVKSIGLDHFFPATEDIRQKHNWPGTSLNKYFGDNKYNSTFLNTYDLADRSKSIMLLDQHGYLPEILDHNLSSDRSDKRTMFTASLIGASVGMTAGILVGKSVKLEEGILSGTRTLFEIVYGAVGFGVGGITGHFIGRGIVAERSSKESHDLK